MNRSMVIVALAGLALVASACSSSGSSGGSPLGGSETDAFGESADPSSVDRTIEIVQLDTLRFEPSFVSVKAGETIRFEITNEGSMSHEFVLGDQTFQSGHESEMAGMGGSMPPDTPYSVGVDPSATKTVVWRFTEPGLVFFGCHVAGHYAAGMVGQITVEA